jgi:hypothetical protein
MVMRRKAQKPGEYHYIIVNSKPNELPITQRVRGN